MMSPSVPLQGGCWGLECPAGHPRHPSFPLPFVPWGGNRHFGGWWAWQEALVEAFLPSPSLTPKPSDWPALTLSPCCWKKHDLTFSVLVALRWRHTHRTNQLPLPVHVNKHHLVNVLLVILTNGDLMLLTNLTYLFWIICCNVINIPVNSLVVSKFSKLPIW